MLYHTYLMMIMKSKLPPWEQPRLILHVSAHRHSVCVLLLAPLQQMIADTSVHGWHGIQASWIPCQPV